MPVIRRIRPGDGPRIRELRLEMLADTPIAYGESLQTASADPLERWLAQAERNAVGCEHATFVAEKDDRFVGTAGGLTDGERTFVVSVYIAPDHRGQRILAGLIDAVAAWSLASGRSELVLEVAAENPRAIAAYDRLGFRLTGASQPHPLYAGVTEQEMVRAAAAG